MKYLFVLGRNPLLSEAEILSCLERDSIKVKSCSLKINGLLIDVDGELRLNELVSELGGTIAAGKVLMSGNIDNLSKEIRSKPIYFGRENKVVYSLLDFTSGEESFTEVLEAIKDNFKEERLKARYKGVGGTIKMQTGEVVHGSPTKIMLRDMNYFVFSEENGNLNFGYLEESYDSDKAEKKDMEKPYRRESLAISPRLARILVNLSQVKKGGILLDPFCGIGVIVGEAMLKGIDVIGIDIDSNAITNAKANIDWLRSKYKIEARAQLICSDSRTVKIREADGIATEPLLGELMTKIPSKEKALQIVSEFETLLIDVLNNLKKFMKRGSKIAFTSPLIKSQKGKVSCNIEKICEKTSLNLHKISSSGIIFPIQEFREEQIVGREILVLTSYM